MDLSLDESVIKTFEGETVRMGPLTEDADLEMNLDLSKVPGLGPSFISMAQTPPETEEDLCAVRHFLRLVVYTPPKFCWNTNEIFLHRAVSDVKFDLDV